MTMQEKMNIADNVNNNSSSDEDDEDLDQAATADKLKLANQGEILNAARPSSSESEKRLTFNSLPMGESLPEDQEIISELDEEEEEDVWGDVPFWFESNEYQLQLFTGLRSKKRNFDLILTID